MNTKHTILSLGLVGALAGSLVTAGCESGGAKRASRRAPERDTAGSAESRVTTPGGRSINSSRIVTMTSTERDALRERALALLIAASQKGTPEERANAIESLTATPGRLSGIAERSLRDQSAAVRAVAAMAIGKAMLTNLSAQVRPLLQDDSPYVRGAAMFALKKCSQPVDLSPLAGVMFDPNPRLRAYAAFIIGELGDKSALGMLRDAHKHTGARANPSEVKVSDLQIAEARIKLGDDSALSDVRAALFPAKPEDLEAAVLAIQLVGQLKDTVSTNRLIQLTMPKDPNGQEMPGEVRMAAAASLAKLGQPQGSYIAREYFRGGSETLRAQAANLFGETRERENLQLVSQLMDDPDGRVRVAAAAAVVKVTEPQG